MKTKKRKVTSSVHTAVGRRVEAKLNHAVILDDYVMLTMTQEQAEKLLKALAVTEAGDCLDPVFSVLNDAVGEKD